MKIIKETADQLFQQELEDTKNNTMQRQMIIQKYGFIEPKLTQYEQFMIADELTSKLEGR